MKFRLEAQGGPVQDREKRWGKKERESCWKSGGGRVLLYAWPRVGLADEASSDAMPEAAGGE